MGIGCMIKEKIRTALSAKESTVNKLKPCPFCGGKAELYESEAYNLKTETKEKNIRWFVMCEQCTALTCGALKGKAIEAWNRRDGV